jgi:hypothetical protein
MIKYLAKKNHTYWYRRKINKFGKIFLSLRHSYIDFKIKELIYKGAFHTMNVQEIRALIDKYKIYMIEEEYNDFEELRDKDLEIEIQGTKFEELRDKDLEIEIQGTKYGAHTKQALDYAINRYIQIHKEDNLNLIKEETSKILKRSNFTNEDLTLLETNKDRKIFHWELFKAELELLQRAYDEQKKIIKESDKQKTIITPEQIRTYRSE